MTEDSRRVLLTRSRVALRSPGGVMPGTLELLGDRVEFKPDWATWFITKTGGRRDLTIRRSCIARVRQLSRWRSMVRGSPRRLTAIELLSGKRILFIPPRHIDWEESLQRLGATAAGPCAELDARLTQITRSMWADTVITLAIAGMALLMFAVWENPPPLVVIGAMLVSRYSLRWLVWGRNSRGRGG